MLNLNSKDETSKSSDTTSIGDTSNLTLVGGATNDPVWKVLIYDQVGKDIISPLMKVNELRENGITVHMYVAGWLII
jgi:hypothetical protein